MGGLRVASLNVRGLKMVKRRIAFFESLSFVRFDVMFLQECHLESSRDEILFSKEWGKGPAIWGAGETADGRDRFYIILDKVKIFYMKEAGKFMVEMGAR